jgi:hypothetical protein
VSGLADAIIAIVIAVFFIAIGVVIIWALAPVNLFMVIVGVALLVLPAIAVVVGFIRNNV